MQQDYFPPADTLAVLDLYPTARLLRTQAALVEKFGPAVTSVRFCVEFCVVFALHALRGHALLRRRHHRHQQPPCRCNAETSPL